MNSRLLKVLCITGALLSSSGFAQQQNMKNKDMSSNSNCSSSRMAPDDALAESYPAAYNAPAAVKTTGGWDLAIDGSFIYWYVNQENMDIGRSALYNAAGPVLASKASVATQHFSYEPGFKVGLEFNTRNDDWIVRADYLWLHFQKNSNFGTTPAAMVNNSNIYIPNDNFVNGAASESSHLQSPEMTSHWKMHMDMVDLTTSRPFYQGRNVVVAPYGGLRGLWIRQIVRATAVNAANLTVTPMTFKTLTQNWAIGPTTGASGRYLMGAGFRFEGNMGFSLLYTKYIKLSHKENYQTGAILPLNGSLPNFGAVRPSAEMGLGFGWGSYFSKNNYHVDFSASYDFTVFWNQNMTRQIVAALSNDNVGYAAPAGDLMMQGLTLNASLDF